MSDGAVPAEQVGRRHPGVSITLSAVLSVLVAVTAGVTGAHLLRGTRPATVTDRAALAAVLDDRATALLRHDRAGWLSAVDPGSSTARATQAEAFDRITALPLAAWTYHLTELSAPLTELSAPLTELSAPDGGPVSTPVPGRRYRAQLTLTYRLSGDTRDVRRSRTATVVLNGDTDPGPGQWLLESEHPSTEADRDLWDLASPAVARSGRGVAVTMGGTPSQAAGLASGADAAARTVDAVWGPSWPRTVLVVLPRDGQQFAALTGRPGWSGYDRLAAVTTGPVERGGGSGSVAGSADRVVLNPQLWGRLTDTGRRVVLAHELTHVATRATTTATPPAWLEEGFAGYVGYLGQAVPDAEIAADALPAVRAGRLPHSLPGPGDFDPAAGSSGAAYAQAWVACDLIASRSGLSGLVTVYREAATGDGGEAAADAALQKVLQQPAGSLISAWQARLRRIAGVGS